MEKKGLEFKPLSKEEGLQEMIALSDLQAAKVGDTIVAIGVRRQPCYWIMCYIPKPDIFKKIEPDIRKMLINKYAELGIISKEHVEIFEQGL